MTDDLRSVEMLQDAIADETYRIIVSERKRALAESELFARHTALAPTRIEQARDRGIQRFYRKHRVQ